VILCGPCALTTSRFLILAPSIWDEPEPESEPSTKPEPEPEPESYLVVDFDKLVLAHVREPDRRALRQTKAGRRGGLHALEIEFYIDEHGQVVKAKHVRGDKELARVYIKTALGWQFDPYEYNGRATRVVTKQQIMVDLDRELDEPA
jgi:hypothetical protein